MLHDGSRSRRLGFVGVRLTGERFGWKRRALDGVLTGLDGPPEDGVGGVVTLALVFFSLPADFLSSSKR